MESLYSVLVNEKDKAFLNCLIKSSLTKEKISSVIWDYVLENKVHTLFYCFKWQGSTIHDIIKEVERRQAVKEVLN